MDAEREREIRELAVRLLGSKRHHRIGVVLRELLGEIDVLRQDEPPDDWNLAEAMEKLAAFAAKLPTPDGDGAKRWREATLAKLPAYPNGLSRPAPLTPREPLDLIS